MNPGVASGCVLHWKASRATIDGSGNATSVIDLSRLRTNLTQLTASRRPAWNGADGAFGGKPTITFAKGASAIALADGINRTVSNSARTIFSCMRSTDVTGGTVLIQRSTAPLAAFMLFPAGGLNFLFTDGVIAQTATFPAIINRTIIVVMQTTGPAGAGVTLARINGITLAIGSGATASADTGAALTMIASASDTTQTWAGPVSEQFMFDRALELGEIRAYERYLASEYKVLGVRQFS